MNCFRSECNPDFLVIQIENGGQGGGEFHKVTQSRAVAKLVPQFRAVLTGQADFQSFWLLPWPLDELLASHHLLLVICFLSDMEQCPLWSQSPEARNLCLWDIYPNDQKYPDANFDFFLKAL